MHEEDICCSSKCELIHKNLHKSPKLQNPSATLALQESCDSKVFHQRIGVKDELFFPLHTRLQHSHMHQPRCDNISQQCAWHACTCMHACGIILIPILILTLDCRVLLIIMFMMRHLVT